jgi:hypothetical protein
MSQYVLPEKEIMDASALGGGVDIRIGIIGKLHCYLSGGYQFYTIHQDSALERWNWQFWETRYKGNVSVALQGDSTITAALVPSQKMDLFPVFFILGFDIVDNPDLQIDLQYGIGIMFYYRKLILEETWRKYFSSVNYQFEYSYENFAPPKVGNPLASLYAVNITYKLSDMFGISCSARYMNIHNTENEFNFNNFPFKRSFDTKLGLTIFY